jgi:hypothetical protein
MLEIKDPKKKEAAAGGRAAGYNERCMEVAPTQPDSDVSQFFSADPAAIESRAAVLAERIAIEDEALTRMDRELKDRKSKLEAAKEELATLLLSNGLDAIKLSSGLNPQARVDRKIYKASGVTDEQLFEWLEAQDLGNIIKCTVHFSTLQAAIKEHVDQGNDLPENLFLVSDKKTIRMGGKSKFLANRQAEVTG